MSTQDKLAMAVDTLRPEARKALATVDFYFNDGAEWTGWPEVRAELLRLASENMELRGANKRMKFLLDSAEAELAALKDENAQLRDVLADRDMDREMAAHANKELAALKAEMDQLRADAETGKAWRTDNSLEEWFPMTAAELRHVKGELAALKARIAEAPTAIVGRCALNSSPEYNIVTACSPLDGKRVRLVVED